jgi:hypothetical protein
MTASTVLLPSVRCAFGELVDYAGLFPPAELSLTQAVQEYHEARTGPYAWILGRFIITAPLLVGSAESADPFSVILEGAPETLAALATSRSHGTRIEALEIPLDKSTASDAAPDAIALIKENIAVAALDDLPAYVELPRHENWASSLSSTMMALRAGSMHAKIRCGGATEDAFPSVAEVATFIRAARHANVSFKATAGLHHPIRHRDAATGFFMHGFFNLLTAAALAMRVSPRMLEQVIAEEDAAAFRFDDDSLAWRDQRVTLGELEATRRDAFVAYGSCSFSEPVDDLKALGLLSAQ